VGKTGFEGLIEGSRKLAFKVVGILSGRIEPGKLVKEMQ